MNGVPERIFLAIALMNEDAELSKVILPFCTLRSRTDDYLTHEVYAGESLPRAGEKEAVVSKLLKARARFEPRHDGNVYVYPGADSTYKNLADRLNHWAVETAPTDFVELSGDHSGKHCFKCLWAGSMEIAEIALDSLILGYESVKKARLQRFKEELIALTT